MNIYTNIKQKERKNEVTRHMEDIWTKHHDPVEKQKRQLVKIRETIKSDKQNNYVSI